MKKNLITHSITVITILWIIYSLVICFAPLSILQGSSNLMLDFKPLNLGEFGGFLSGIFAPLAFLWLFQNFKQQSQNLEIAQKQLQILIEERENKRKVKKAYFKPEKSQHNDSGIYIVTFKPRNPAFNINTRLHAPKDAIEVLITDKYYHDFIYSSEELEITFNVKTTVTDPNEKAWILEISYLDEDGYDCQELFHIHMHDLSKNLLASSLINEEDYPFKEHHSVLKKSNG